MNILIIIVQHILRNRKKILSKNINEGNLDNHFIKPNSYCLREIDPSKLNLYEEEIDFLIMIEEISNKEYEYLAAMNDDVVSLSIYYKLYII